MKSLLTLYQIFSPCQTDSFKEDFSRFNSSLSVAAGCGLSAEHFARHCGISDWSGTSNVWSGLHRMVRVLSVASESHLSEVSFCRNTVHVRVYCTVQWCDILVKLYLISLPNTVHHKSLFMAGGDRIGAPVQTTDTIFENQNLHIRSS